LAYSSYFFLVGFDFFEVGWDYMISAVMSLAIYGIGYMAFTQPQIFNGIFLQQIFVPKKYKSSQLTDSMADELFNKIQDYFISDEPYLNPELRQAHVCEKLSFTTHQISQVINQKTNATFSAFVKNYRLGYAENMIRENPEIDIKTVYYQSGFNNKTSFNSAFKQKLGITPSVFKERVQIENQKK
jgi:AraC-like DNA-binding protein